MIEVKYIVPSWKAPLNVKSLMTLKAKNFDFSLNNSNRNLCTENLRKNLDLPEKVLWLQQIHSTKVIDFDKKLVNNYFLQQEFLKADASITKVENVALAILTADCVPILITDNKGKEIAAVHAGWRGLVNGIIENVVSKFSVAAKDLIIWIGPCISRKKFEVGLDVKEQFFLKAKDPSMVKDAFFELGNEKYLADLHLLAKDRLFNLGVLSNNIYCSEYCTFIDDDKFYSFRKNKDERRMASIIWIE